MDQLMSALKEMEGGRSLQKKISKIPQQQVESMLKKYGALGSTLSSAEGLSARDKLRQKIREKELTRVDKAGQEIMRQKENKRLQKEEMLKEPVLTETEKEIKEKARMKRLRKQFKTVSDEDYFASLEQILNHTDVKADVRQRHQNIVDLYNYQHRDQINEKQLDLELDE